MVAAPDEPAVSVAVVSFILAICAVPTPCHGRFRGGGVFSTYSTTTTSNAVTSTLFSVPGAPGVPASGVHAVVQERGPRAEEGSPPLDGATKNLKKRDGKSNRRKSSSRDRRRIGGLHLHGTLKVTSTALRVDISQVPHQDQVNLRALGLVLEEPRRKGLAAAQRDISGITRAGTIQRSIARHCVYWRPLFLCNCFDFALDIFAEFRLTSRRGCLQPTTCSTGNVSRVTTL